MQTKKRNNMYIILKSKKDDVQLFNLWAKTLLIYIITLCSELHKYMKVYIIRPSLCISISNSATNSKNTNKPWHVFPAVQVVMWFKTFFIVWQWGKLQGLTAPFWACCSRLWHLCAWSKRTSCCCINLLFSGSGVGGWANPDPGWRENKSPQIN